MEIDFGNQHQKRYKRVIFVKYNHSEYIGRDGKQLPRGCKIIEFPWLMTAGTFVCRRTRHIPFQIERVFWIYDVPEEDCGGHSHCETASLIPLNGSFTTTVDDGRHSAEVRMESSGKGILIPQGVWCHLHDFAPGTICLVFASHPYDASGYINDYSEYLNEQLSVVRYDLSRQTEWDSFVRISKNGTFLLERGYMDYHAARFTDCSLMFYKKGNLIVSAGQLKEEEGTAQSHGGLTYGGLIALRQWAAINVLEVFSCAID